MSGGRWDYASDTFRSIAHAIEEIIDINAVSSKEMYGEKFYSLFDEIYDRRNFSDEVMAELKKAVTYMKLSAVYERRIDWLMSGDDGEELFLRRLREDLNAERLTGNG